MNDSDFILMFRCFCLVWADSKAFVLLLRGLASAEDCFLISAKILFDGSQVSKSTSVLTLESVGDAHEVFPR